MKGAFLHSLITFLVSVAFVQCDRLTEFIEARTLKRTVNHVNDQDSTNHDHYYLPVYVGPQEWLKEADKITGLPGEPINEGNFDQYAGYVTVDPKAGRALYYCFAESENSSSKPLVLWLNGGPGCSSIGAGAMTELGPFRVSKDGKTLWYNQYAWNTMANVLFLESPAGVGFSYSNTTSDYVTGDRQTAEDSYVFLVNWLERSLEYKTRDFLITGESYAGHYVPQLAKLILDYNKVTKKTVINLKGIAVGNAYIDNETQNKGTYDYLWSHGLISDEIHEGIVSYCNFSSQDTISVTCQEYMDQADAAKGHIYDYDIYAPLRSSSSTIPLISIFDPCSGSYVFSYLNTIEVQKSLHASFSEIPVKWYGCSKFVGKNWQDMPDSVLPVIQEVMASGISVWIYSGDTDAVVALTTTRYGIHKLNTTVKTAWYPWYSQGEVGGYVVEYQNLTLVTIRGAGHFVPSYQPARALTFFSSFLEGKLPPSNQN